MRLPSIINEPCLSYASGSIEFQKLKQTLMDMMNVVFDVPLVINGERVPFIIGWLITPTRVDFHVKDEHTDDAG